MRASIRISTHTLLSDVAGSAFEQGNDSCRLLHERGKGDSLHACTFVFQVLSHPQFCPSALDMHLATPCSWLLTALLRTPALQASVQDRALQRAEGHCRGLLREEGVSEAAAQ